MNKTDKRVCPEFRPLMAQANAGEGKFRAVVSLAHAHDGPVVFTPIGDRYGGELHLDTEASGPFTPVGDQESGRRWYQLRQPKGQWKRGADEPGGKSLHEIGGYQPSHAPEDAHPPATDQVFMAPEKETDAQHQGWWDTITPPSQCPTGKDPDLDEPPIDSDMFEPAATFKALLDRFERMCQLQEARAIKHAPHPTRERLLEAVRWALGEDEHHSVKEFEPGEMFRARLRRLAGL